MVLGAARLGAIRRRVAWLERVWSRTEKVPGLTLAETDFIALAQELAVRGVPAWREILDQQLARIENPDRKAQFAFVRPALSADVGVRDAFFERLKEPANRRREPWVLEGLCYLHHPLRAAAAEKHIPPSLALLREIQRTGDIFFPKRWMDATLGGHQSATAARRSRRFLAELPPDYPDRLRRVILVVGGRSVPGCTIDAVIRVCRRYALGLALPLAAALDVDEPETADQKLQTLRATLSGTSRDRRSTASGGAAACRRRGAERASC